MISLPAIGEETLLHLGQLPLLGRLVQHQILDGLHPGGAEPTRMRNVFVSEKKITEFFTLKMEKTH